MKQRNIKNVRTVRPSQESPIHRVGMLIEPGTFEESDPFLFMAEDWFQEGVFDYHPHRGIETVTYVIEGTLAHFDNNAGSGELQAGDAQWMTAGRGVIHKETAPGDQKVHTLQLWVNLPKANKMTDPRYQDLHVQDLPVHTEEGASIRVFSGSAGDAQAGTRNYVPVTMLEITVEPGATVTPTLPGSYNGFLYVLEGKGTFGSEQVEGAKQQVLWLGAGEAGEPSGITITAQEKLRVMLYAGEPVRERVVSRGPFVMNTEQEIVQAFTDYYNGKFVNDPNLVV